MKMRDFAFHEPGNLSEVCHLLARYEGEAKIIAGGTDLLVDLKHRSISIEHLVSISGLEGLKEIAVVERPPSMEGRFLSVILTPSKKGPAPKEKKKAPVEERVG